MGNKASEDERIQAAIKQVCLFIDASTQGSPIDYDALNKEIPKVRACLYFVGASDALTQHYELSENDFIKVTLHALIHFGLSPDNAQYVVINYQEIAQEPYNYDALREGGLTILAWLSGKDPVAPIRLTELVNIWNNEI